MAVVMAVSVGLTGLLSACGSTATPQRTSTAATVDSAGVERAIAASIKSERNETASVTCPPDQPVAVHREFRCAAQVGTRITAFLVTESNAAGKVSYVGVSAADTPSVNGSRVAEAIEQSIQSARHTQATVQCPAGVPLQQGLSFVCVAQTRAGARTDFTVSQTDGHGHVTYRAG